jgi:hypothetical protein
VIPPPGSCSNDSHSYINAATSRVSNVEEDMYLPMGGVKDRTSSVSETPSHETTVTLARPCLYLNCSCLRLIFYCLVEYFGRVLVAGEILAEGVLREGLVNQCQNLVVSYKYCAVKLLY